MNEIQGIDFPSTIEAPTCMIIRAGDAEPSFWTFAHPHNSKPLHRSYELQDLLLHNSSR